jgi:uncharacterized protein YdeI (YjbR/CyaY-like superfamily)
MIKIKNQKKGKFIHKCYREKKEAVLLQSGVQSYYLILFIKIMIMYRSLTK